MVQDLREDIGERKSSTEEDLEEKSGSGDCPVDVSDVLAVRFHLFQPFFATLTQIDLEVPAGNPFAPANSVGMSALPRAEAIAKYAKLAVTFFLAQYKRET